MPYKINEIFFSIQGEGLRAGTANIFVRFSNCNLRCDVTNEAGFSCDTEFLSGRDFSLGELVSEIERVGRTCRNIIFTGGEPGLQLDNNLIEMLKGRGYYLCVETNGTVELPVLLDWITVSPKTAEHTLRVKKAHELKYVRHAGQGIPKPALEADAYLISPAFGSDGLDVENLKWCINLVKENPTWRLSVQQHKIWRVR